MLAQSRHDIVGDCGTSPAAGVGPVSNCTLGRHRPRDIGPCSVVSRTEPDTVKNVYPPATGPIPIIIINYVKRFYVPLLAYANAKTRRASQQNTKK
jgi:hypothetical protein